MNKYIPKLIDSGNYRKFKSSRIFKDVEICKTSDTNTLPLKEVVELALNLSSELSKIKPIDLNSITTRMIRKSDKDIVAYAPGRKGIKLTDISKGIFGASIKTTYSWQNNYHLPKYSLFKSHIYLVQTYSTLNSEICTGYQIIDNKCLTSSIMKVLATPIIKYPKLATTAVLFILLIYFLTNNLFYASFINESYHAKIEAGDKFLSQNEFDKARNEYNEALAATIFSDDREKAVKNKLKILDETEVKYILAIEETKKAKLAKTQKKPKETSTTTKQPKEIVIESKQEATPQANNLISKVEKNTHTEKHKIEFLESDKETDTKVVEKTESHIRRSYSLGETVEGGIVYSVDKNTVKIFKVLNNWKGYNYSSAAHECSSYQEGWRMVSPSDILVITKNFRKQIGSSVWLSNGHSYDMSSGTIKSNASHNSALLAVVVKEL